MSTSSLNPHRDVCLSEIKANHIAFIIRDSISSTFRRNRDLIVAIKIGIVGESKRQLCSSIVKLFCVRGVFGLWIRGSGRCVISMPSIIW